MKIYKKILAVVLAVLIIVYTPCVSIASNQSTNHNSRKYEEYHDQINFDDLYGICSK